MVGGDAVVNGGGGGGGVDEEAATGGRDTVWLGGGGDDDTGQLTINEPGLRQTGHTLSERLLFSVGCLWGGSIFCFVARGGVPSTKKKESWQ